MTCAQCGIINAAGATLCVHCGAPLNPPPDQAPPPADEPAPTPASSAGTPGDPTAPVPPGAPDPGTLPPSGAPEASTAYPPPPGPDPSGSFPPEALAPGAPYPAPGGPPPGGPGFPELPPGYPGGPYGGGGRSNRGPLLVILGVLVVAALVGGAVLLTGGDDESGGLAGASIRLEPLGSTQDDDFAGNLDLEPLGESAAVALGEVPARHDQVSTGLSGQVATGTEPGLYGGSQDTEVCDMAALVEFLTDDENRGQGEAFAEVQSITVDGIADFVADLTPMRLRFDTRVTNHGYDGGPTPFQSVLQAGTAVLVDDTGVPRVKCNCGNPLLPPEPVSGADEAAAFDLENLAENPDDAWESLDPASVVTVEAGDETLVDFTLLALEDGTIFVRPVGTDGTEDEPAENMGDLCTELVGSPTCDEPELGTGDVQVTLRWDSTADLDLHVTDPGGEEISYSSQTSGSGGELDVDANGGCSNASPTPVENIFWPEGQAPEGSYQVEVVGFSDCEVGDADYTLTVRVGGEVVLEESGTMADGGSDPYSFEA